MKRISTILTTMIAAFALIGCGTTSGGLPAYCDDPSTGDLTGCTTVEIVEGEITAALTNWTNDTCYALRNNVFVVGTEATTAVLDIEEGTQIFGLDDGCSSQAPSLIVTTRGRIEAGGEPTEPIVFTPADLAEDGKVPSDFGGVVLLGKANGNKGENNIEGLPTDNDLGLYSDDTTPDDTHDCGTVMYTRIEYAGFKIGDDNELNGLTLGGCGSDTVLQYIQVHKGLDDGIEFFGGTADIQYAIISGPGDDGLDYDEGWTGNGKNIIVHQFTDRGDRAIEADNNGSDFDAVPRTKPTLENVTLIGRPDKSRTAMKLREGVQGNLYNFLIQSFLQVMDVDSCTGRDEITDECTFGDPLTSASWDTDLFVTESAFADNTRLGDDDTTPTLTNDTTDTGDPSNNLFDEATELTDDESNGVSVGALLDLGLTPETAPNYQPTADEALDKSAPPTGGAYAGAVDPDGVDWTATGWTAFP